ncbi:MAG: FtsQ-type POTRA domain-containing protein [Candidatus Margulisiibacteriota bacterium]
MKARTKKKRSFRFKLFLFLAGAVLFSLATYYILALPIWRIQDVVVNGANLLSAEEVRDLSGVPVAENLFLTSFARVRDNLKKITAIKEFHIYRIPPATVLIRISERRPFAVLLLNGRSAIIDREGYILNRSANLTFNIPKMTELPVFSARGTAEGEQVDPRAAELAGQVIGELSPMLGARNLHAEISDYEKINFLLDDLLRVKLGRNEEIKRKLAVFRALLPAVEGNWPAVEYIDVRYPDNPVIKYK